MSDRSSVSCNHVSTTTLAGRESKTHKMLLISSTCSSITVERLPLPTLVKYLPAISRALVEGYLRKDQIVYRSFFSMTSKAEWIPFSAIVKQPLRSAKLSVVR